MTGLCSRAGRGYIRAVVAMKTSRGSLYVIETVAHCPSQTTISRERGDAKAGRFTRAPRSTTHGSGRGRGYLAGRPTVTTASYDFSYTRSLRFIGPLSSARRSCFGLAGRNYSDRFGKRRTLLKPTVSGRLQELCSITRLWIDSC